MAEAVALAKLHPPGQVDQALGTAAIAGRFAENDLLRILAHQAGRTVGKPTLQASETHSLQPGTAAWSGFGITTEHITTEQQTNPAPLDPAPLDPAPLDPAPLDPAPLDPAPLDPAPLDPAPLDPAPLDPAPLDPAPLDPAGEQQ
jgi:hypothetical protein